MIVFDTNTGNRLPMWGMMINQHIKSTIISVAVDSQTRDPVDAAVLRPTKNTS